MPIPDAIGPEGTRPLITIGLTVYNAADRVSRAFSSALAQSWRPIEVVAVDDASIDESWAVLSALAAEHPELRIIQQPQNAGVAAARNAIIDVAQGEFIAFFDDDDQSLPHRLESQYQRIVEWEILSGSDRVICHTARRQYWPDGVCRIEPTMGTEQDRPAPAGETVAKRILTGEPAIGTFGACATCSQMARRSLYRLAGGFDNSLRRGEDTELNIRLALLGAHFVGIAEPLVVQHIRANCDKNALTERDHQLWLLELHRDYLERLGSYEFCIRWTRMKFYYLCGNWNRMVSALVALALRYPIQTLKRATWAWPNRRFNRLSRKFYSGRQVGRSESVT